MSDKLFDIPAIAQSVDSAIRNPFNRMREALQTLIGVIGDGSDAAFTSRRINSGAANFGSGAFGGATGSTTEVDRTPPPTVSNFRATAGFSQVIVQWDSAVYTQGHGPKQTNIYGVKRPNPDPGPAPTFGDAQLVDSAIDALNIESIPSELNTTWHLWAKFETVDGVESLAPAGGVNGVIVTTGQDIAQLLKILTGQITSSLLYADLGTRINLIDGASSVPGSVNYRLAATAADLTSAFTQGNAATYASAQTYVQGYAYSKSTVDGAFTSQFNALTANYRAADGATLSSAQGYVQTYAYSKAGTDGAIATSATTVQATLNGNIAAAVQTEATARTNADGNLFAQYTVKLDVNGYVSGYGLASTGGTAAPTSSFIVRADSFAIASPSGPGVAPATPFIVRTTATTENSVSIPAGVYIDAAYIVNVNALYGRFGTLIADSVSTAQLNAARLTLGDGTVGGNLKSANYAGGAAGWVLRPDGYAEFGFENIRGTLNVNQINTRSINTDKLVVGAVTSATQRVANGFVVPVSSSSSESTVVVDLLTLALSGVPVTMGGWMVVSTETPTTCALITINADLLIEGRSFPGGAIRALAPVFNLQGSYQSNVQLPISALQPSLTQGVKTFQIAASIRFYDSAGIPIIISPGSINLTINLYVLEIKV